MLSPKLPAVHDVVNVVNASAALVAIFRAKHAGIFLSGLGLYTESTSIIYLKLGAKPIFRPKRLVPNVALKSIDEELDGLQASRVIKPISYSAWAGSSQVVKKENGSIRLCADSSTELIACSAEHPNPLPSPDDLFSKLNGRKYFQNLICQVLISSLKYRSPTRNYYPQPV